MEKGGGKYSVFKSRINQILPDVLKKLHIDIKVFKERNNKYRIPILFAEIIYIIVKEATNDSSKNSFVSKLKNNKFEELSFNDKVTFINSVFAELKKDYPDFTKNIDKVEFNFLYPYYNVRYLMNFENQLREIQKMIDLPLIGYDKKINDEIHSISIEVGKGIKDKYKEQYNQVIENSGYKLLEQLWSLRGSTFLLQPDEELNECLEIIKNDIETLRKVVERVKKESEETHNNHSLYYDI